MHIQNGQIPLSAIPTHQPLALLHGGAGPADPQAERAKRAQAEMDAICESLIDNPPHPTTVSDSLQNVGRLPRENSAELFALDGVRRLERHPQFNAGLGASLQADGIARVSASFMESQRQIFSCITNATDILNPSALAYFLQFERFSMRDSMGAKDLAEALRIPKANLITPERWEKWQNTKKQNPPVPGRTGTVGTIALSHLGELAAATSTGGVGFEPPGRLGDTPTISGNYCNEWCAVSCTGIGEQINNLGLAFRICHSVKNGMPLLDAVNEVMDEAQQKDYHLAFIAVARSPITKVPTADWCAATLSPSFTWSMVAPKKH